MFTETVQGEKVTFGTEFSGGREVFDNSLLGFLKTY